MTDKVNLDAYFARIGYSGPPAPTLETLCALHLLHTAAIPFENIDPVMGRPVPLDLASLEKKLIHQRRGGYCFEQNSLFLHVLWAMGYKAAGLSARVLRGRPEHLSPRSHMLMRIWLPQGEYVADVGFGSLTLTAPLRLHDESEQETPHGLFRIVKAGDEFEQLAPQEGGWQTQYRFTLHEQQMQDYEALNWYRATHPQSPFVVNLIGARPLPGKRLSLRNNQFTVRYAGGRMERRMLSSPAGIAEVLENEFGIALPAPRAELERALARFVS